MHCLISMLKESIHLWLKPEENHGTEGTLIDLSQKTHTYSIGNFRIHISHILINSGHWVIDFFLVWYEKS